MTRRGGHRPDWRAAIYGRAVTGSGLRRTPSATKRNEILEQQAGRCLYCDLRIGSIIRRFGSPVSLRLNWDHFVPYAYGQTNAESNWVAACHVCNGIKGCRMFDTVTDAQAYIRGRRAAKGYETVLELPARIAAPSAVEKAKPSSSPEPLDVRESVDVEPAAVPANPPIKLSPPGVYDPTSLTPRQRECLELLATGLTHREIAARWRVQTGTVSTHLSWARLILGTPDTPSAISAARALGLIPDPATTPPPTA